MQEYSQEVLSILNANTGAVSTPITNSASYSFTSSQNAKDVFAGKKMQPFYARMGNPTTAKFEKIVAKIEQGQGAIATSTGMGAISLAVMSLTKTNDEIISIGGLFSGIWTLFNEFLDRFGIKTHFIATKNQEDIEKYINKNTKIIFCESISNPALEIPDFEFLAKIANKHNLAFIVDNTLTSLSLKPFSFGADIVVHSTTKIITGNASALGGMAVFRAIKDNDKFYDDKFSFLAPAIKKVGENALIMNAKKRALRDLGVSANAFASYLGILGLETMPLRVQKIDASVIKIAKALYENNVNVNHPSLRNDKAYNKYFSNGCGCLLTIDCESEEKAFKFIDNLKTVVITPNIGDSRTLALHMASTIYGDLDTQTKLFLGVTDGLVRISVGLEDSNLIIEDFLQSYKRIGSL
jgi:O-acetylhomoserine (thiol)-lyase